jgi:hypothetical protein
VDKNIATIMKVIDPNLGLRQFPTIAQKTGKLIDMIDTTLRFTPRNAESPHLLTQLMRNENMRAILGVLGVTGVTAKSPAAEIQSLLQAAVQVPLDTPLEVDRAPELPPPQETQQAQIDETPAESAQAAAAESAEHTRLIHVEFEALQSTNAELMHQVQKMQMQMQQQIEMQEQQLQHQNEKQKLDAEQKLQADEQKEREMAEMRQKVLNMEQQRQQQQQPIAMELLEQQQQPDAGANKRKRPTATTSAKKEGGPSRKRKKSAYGKPTTPISRWAGSFFYKEKKKYDRPIPQKDVDQCETLIATLKGWRSCAGGKLYPLEEATIGKNMFAHFVHWLESSKDLSSHVRIANGTRHKRRHALVFDLSYWEGERDTVPNADGVFEWVEAEFKDDDCEMTADMLFNFNGTGGEPNDAGVHCAYIAAIKNAGVPTTPYGSNGQISYAPTAEELTLTADYNPKYRRILAKRANDELTASCIEVD